MMLLLALSTALLFAQPTAQLSTVEGTVLDASTSLPIAGARVIALRTDGQGWNLGASLLDTQPSVGEQDPKAGQVAVLTGSDGRFRLRFEGPARFALWVDAAGYTRPQMGMDSDNMFEVKPDAPKTDIVFMLPPESSLSGRLIDADTKEPLSDFWMFADSYRSVGSRRFLMPAGESKTGKDGRFSIDRAVPGDCFLKIHPPFGASIGAPKPVENFRRAVQKGYVPSWYPGVDSVGEAVPVHLAPGAHIEGFEIGTSKTRVASIRGRVLADEAAAKTGVHLDLTRVTKGIQTAEFSSVAEGNLQIGSEFEIANLPAGAYYLSAGTPGLEKANAKHAVMSLQVGEENQDGLDLYLTKGVAVTGPVRIDGRDDDPAKPALPTADIEVRLEPAVGFGSDFDPAPAPVAAKDGAFSIENVIPSRYRLGLLSPPEGYAVSEVRYDGALCAHRIVAIEAGANAQKLEVKLASANSAVVAAVADGDQLAAGAILLLAPADVTGETLALRDNSDVLRQTSAGKDGRATVSGLLPGTYRVTAYPQGASWADDPNLLQRLASGVEVELGARQTATITVRTQPVAGQR
jgi:hypothetical protein